MQVVFAILTVEYIIGLIVAEKHFPFTHAVVLRLLRESTTLR